MQEAQASCDGGGSDLSDTPPSLLNITLPRRPSFSLHLYDRFVQNNQNSQSDASIINPDSMDLEEDIPNAIPGVPTTADDAIVAAIPLSPRSSLSMRNSNIPVKSKKKDSKRELIDDSRSAAPAKKSASVVPAPLNNPPVSGQASVSSSPLSSTALTAVSYRYNSKDQPLFVVQVQSTKESESSHPLHISRVVSQIFPREILEIRKIGRSKVLVQTNTYEAANRLATNSSLASYNLRAFIPSYKVLRTGIMRDVPQDLSIEFIKESISSPIKILELHRLNRRTKLDNETSYVPSRTVCIKFAGQVLPLSIFLTVDTRSTHLFPKLGFASLASELDT